MPGSSLLSYKLTKGKRPKSLFGRLADAVVPDSLAAPSRKQVADVVAQRRSAKAKAPAKAANIYSMLK